MNTSLLLGGLSIAAVLMPAGLSPAGRPNTADPAVRAPAAARPLASYLEIRRVRDASFSHDDRFIAYRSDAGGRLDIWVRAVSGGAARQITRVNGVIHAFAFSPVEDRLLYEADDGGNDEPRLYFTDSAGSPARELLPQLPKGTRIGFLRWAPDGRTLLYITNTRGADYVELHEFDVNTGASTTIWKSPSNRSLALVSPDLQRFVLQEILSNVNFNLYLLERGGGEPRLLTPHTGDIAYSPTAFGMDGRTLYYTSSEDGEFTGLFRMDVQTGRTQRVHEAPWDVERGEFSTGGRYFITVVNEDGAPRVTLNVVGTERTVALPEVPAGRLVPVTFSPSDRYLAASLSSDAAPDTLYLVDLERGAASPLEDTLPPDLRGVPMVSARAVRIQSFDGREVPALLYQPEGSGRRPAIIDVHGGPNAQARRVFSGMRQYLVSKGYAVLVPNVRGSTGFGKTWAALDDLDLGGGPLKDIVACREWLVANGVADPKRVAIVGASYGGYMTLAAAAFAPGTFAAHVDFFGISDLKSFVESLPPYWVVYSPYTYRKYGNPKDPAHARYQYERSPLNFVDRIRDPLLVVQGANDPQVRREQSERLVDALKSRGAPVHYLLLEGEGHGFSRNASRLAAYEAMDAFLDRYLFGDRSAAVLP